MRRSAWPPALDRRAPRRSTDSGSALAHDYDEVMGLQHSAGNAAVVAALEGAPAPGRLPGVQRQPKTKPPKQTPQFVKDAQAELASLFPKDKLMGKVTIKDYGDLNKVLSSSSTFMAWTQSSNEIFVKDTSGLGDPDANDRPKQLLRYILKHEAVHIGQFAKAKGPPSTWEQMLKFEQEAYKHDLTWLNGSQGTALLPSDDVRQEAIASATAALASIAKVLAAAAKLKGQKREDKLFDEMLTQDLIPSGASKNPRDLYKQP